MNTSRQWARCGHCRCGIPPCPFVSHLATAKLPAPASHLPLLPELHVPALPAQPAARGPAKGGLQRGAGLAGVWLFNCSLQQGQALSGQMHGGIDSRGRRARCSPAPSHIFPTTGLLSTGDCELHQGHAPGSGGRRLVSHPLHASWAGRWLGLAGVVGRRAPRALHQMQIAPLNQAGAGCGIPNPATCPQSYPCPATCST